MIQFTYGIAALASLWALGGGNINLFWNRLLILSLILVGLAATTVIQQKKQSLLQFNRKDLKLGFGTGLLTALPFIAVIFWLKRGPDAHLVNVLMPPGIFSILVISFLAAPASEIISRGFLVPAWGLGSVAFLDALTIGFGIQMLIPFLVSWGMGYVFGTLSLRFSVMTAIISRCIWSLLVLAALYLF